MFKSQASTFLKPLPYCQGTSYTRRKLSLRTKAVLGKLLVTNRDSSCLLRITWGDLVPSPPFFSTAPHRMGRAHHVCPALDKDYVQTASSSLPQHQTLSLKHPQSIRNSKGAASRRQKTRDEHEVLSPCPHFPPHLLYGHNLSSLSFSTSERENANVPPWPNE